MALYLLSLSSLPAWDFLHQNVFEQYQSPSDLQKVVPTSVLTHDFRLGMFLTAIAITSWILSTLPGCVQILSGCLPSFNTLSLGRFSPCLIMCTPITTLLLPKLGQKGIQNLFFEDIVFEDIGFPKGVTQSLFKKIIFSIAKLPGHLTIASKALLLKDNAFRPDQLNNSLQGLYSGIVHNILGLLIIMHAIWVWWGISFNAMLISTACGTAHWALIVLSLTKNSIKKITSSPEHAPGLHLPLMHIAFAIFNAAEYALFSLYPTPSALSPTGILAIQTWFTIEIIAHITATAFSLTQLAIQKSRL